MGSAPYSDGTFESKASGTPDTNSVAHPPGALLDTEPHITRIGSYVPLHKLGQGGMGVVYAAYDEKLDRKVALKLMRSRGSQVGRLRMIREARAMAKLSHPNVAQVYGIEESAEQLCIVVEFVDGVTLKAWLAEKARSRAEILAVFRSAGLGLAAAHAAGLVHRDFKPDNVMIRRDGRVLVMDFGLVQADKSDSGDDADAEPVDNPAGQLTRTGAVMGTPAYMAPEQFLGRDVDARSDQFSFCVGLWEALMGQRPFVAESVDKLAQVVTSGRLTQVERSEIPAWLRDVLMRGLAVEPAQRWPSMDALLGALERDPERRRRWMLGIAAGLGLGAVITWAVVREARQRELELAKSQAVLAQQEEELASKQHELERQRRAIDDAANVQRAQQATMLVGERRGLEALLLAVEAAGPYWPDYMSAPTEVLQALFDVQTVSIVGLSKVIAAEPNMRHVVLSPNDSYVIGVMIEPTALIWTLDGTLIGRLEGHVPPDAEPISSVSACAIRFSGQGEPIELLTADKTGRIWNARGDLLFSPGSGRIEVGDVWSTWAESTIPLDPVLFSRERNIAISPTGNTIVFYDDENKTFELWLSSEREMTSIDSRDGRPGQLSAGFSADGTRVVMSPGIGRIFSYDETRGLLGVSDDVATAHAIAVAPDGMQTVTAERRVAHLRDETGRTIRALEGHTSNVKSVAYDPAGAFLATGGDDRTIRLWHLDGQPSVVLSGHAGRVQGLTFTSDGSRLVSCDDAETVRLWNVYGPLASLPRLNVNESDGFSLSSDGMLAAAPGSARLYRSDGTLLVESEQPFEAFGFAPDSSLFAAVDGAGYVRLWDRGGNMVGGVDVGIKKPRRIVFDPDSSRFFVLGDSDLQCVWDMKGLCTAQLPTNGPPREAMFAADVGQLMTYTPNEGLRLWAISGETVADPIGLDIFPALPDDKVSMDSLPGGKGVGLLLRESLYIWDQSGVLLTKFDVGEESSHMAFGPDGRLIATVGDRIDIWTTEGRLVTTMDGHSDYIHTVDFSPDGECLLTSSSDAVQLWTTDGSRQITLLRHSHKWGQMSFSTDGSRIIENGAPPKIWLLPPAAMARACEILPNFPNDYPRVAHICERVRAFAPPP